MDARNSGGARQDAIGVARSSLDLQLQYREPAVVDLFQLDLWTHQVLGDAQANDPAAIARDMSTLETIWV